MPWGTMLIWGTMAWSQTPRAQNGGNRARAPDAPCHSAPVSDWCPRPCVPILGWWSVTRCLGTPISGWCPVLRCPGARIHDWCPVPPFMNVAPCPINAWCPVPRRHRTSVPRPGLQVTVLLEMQKRMQVISHHHLREKYIFQYKKLSCEHCLTASISATSAKIKASLVHTEVIQ